MIYKPILKLRYIEYILRYIYMKLKKQVFSKPFNIVYETKYPNLVIGPGTYENKEDAIDNSPQKWIKNDVLKIEKNRSKQLFAYKNYSKMDARVPSKDIEEIQHLIKADKETEIEINVDSKKINLTEKISGINNKGMVLENIKIVDNIKIPKPIDKLTSDTQLKAKDAIIEYYNKTEDVYKIEQLLSMGLLGLKKDRIFVPTRWSITSIDDVLGKEIFLKIKNNKTIDRIKMHKYDFYENTFYVIFLPLAWGFEMIEIVNKEVVSYDFEINEPKKDYAYQVTGAYYAARLMALNHLQEIGVCARVIVLRDINQSYTSKGVWVIREAVREAIKKEEIVFEDVNKLIPYISDTLCFRWIMQKSEILKQIKYQKRIFDF